MQNAKSGADAKVYRRQRLNAEWHVAQGIAAAERVDGLLLYMRMPTIRSGEKPYDIHERLLIFACDIVRTAQFLHDRGGVARALSYQLLSAGTSAGANAEEGDGATSPSDFIAKMRIALREAKETRFRLRVCRRVGLLDSSFDPLIDESGQLVKILATIVHNAVRNRNSRCWPKPASPGTDRDDDDP